jgi:hypothetical protein
MKELKAIALHTLEFLVVVGAALGIGKFFNIDNQTEQLLIAAVLAAFAKLGRELLGDFVNK